MDRSLPAHVSLHVIKKLFETAEGPSTKIITDDKEVMCDYLESITDSIEDIITGDTQPIDVIVKYFNENKWPLFGKVAANQMEYKDQLDSSEQDNTAFTFESHEDLSTHLMTEYNDNLNVLSTKLNSSEIRLINVDEVIYLVTK